MNMTIKKNKAGNTVKGGAANPIKANNSYAEAAEYIRSAISALGKSAQKSDVLARESIANLSVVLMDLR